MTPDYKSFLICGSTLQMATSGSLETEFYLNHQARRLDGVGF
jgi:hypothetical protein